MKSKLLIAVVAIIAIVVVSGILIYNNFNQNASPTGAYSVTDDAGFTTQFEAVPQRIISLAPSNTQILFAIGVGDRVVGVSEYDNYPYNFTAWFEAGNMTNIGGFSNPNKETIASLQPDLLLATTIHDPDLANYRSLGYKVLTLNPTNVSTVLNDILMVGKATGAESSAQAVVDSTNKEISDIEAKIAAANLPKPKVYYEVWTPPLMSAGGTSFINDVISKAGGINIFADEQEQYPTISSETIVQKNPDVILLPTEMSTTGQAPFYGSVADVLARPGWSSISAIQNNRVVIVSGELFVQAGPRIGEQIAVAAEAFYPELFNSP